ncbi:MAG: restriction endonuclease subunit S [Candidatus Omnitrophota bacterium]
MIELTIPKEWRAIKVCDTGVLIKGINYKKHEARNAHEPGLKPILRANNINGNLNFEDLVYVPEKRIVSQQYIERHDILFCMSSGSKHLVGKSSQAEKNFDGSYGAFCALFRPLPAINPRFVGYFFQAPRYRKFISAISKGTNINNLKREHILDIDFCLPSSQEQNQIVDSLEELLSDLDNAIENLKKAQAQLKVYRRAILKKAFIGKWNKVPLQNISEAVGGCAFKSSSFIEQGVYQVIRIGNVRPGLIRLSVSPIFLDSIDEKIASKYLLIPGDVIISLTGTRKKRDYGYTAVVKERHLLLNQRLAYLRFNETCLPEFFLYYSWTESFKDSFFASETGNVGQGNVGMKAIQSTEIPLPSRQEQKQIVQSIESRFSVCDMMEESIVENLQKAEALRQSILKEAFEGNLTEEWRKKHKDLISGENSAEALLIKIKAEKEALQGKSKGKQDHD